MDLFDKSKNFETLAHHNKSKINVGDFVIGKAMYSKFGYVISSIYEVLKVEDNFFIAKIVANLTTKGFTFDVYENYPDGKRPYNQNYYMIIPTKYQKVIAKHLIFA